jgi:phosphatidylserine/phosphatidylglycerophosphate/cardiolipin synthase-like enzyme
MATVLLQIPKRQHHFIVGKGASVLKGLQERHKVCITVPKNEDVHETVRIEGNDKDCAETQIEIENLVSMKLSSHYVTATFKIPKNKHSLLIGKKGVTIHEMQQHSRALIHIPHADEVGDDVEVIGVDDAVKEAEVLIKKHLSAHHFELAGGASQYKKNEAAASSPGINLNQPKIAEALFFPSDQSFDRVIQYLEAIKKSVEVCMFTITDDRLTKELLRAHRRGAVVRIITDDEKSLDLGSDISELKQAGIPVRMDHSTAHMHHKFVVLDGQVLLTGSFNWTRAASHDNQENVIITNEQVLVKAFQAEFDRLFVSFANNK